MNLRELAKSLNLPPTIERFKGADVPIVTETIDLRAALDTGLDYSDFTGDQFPEETAHQYGQGGYKFQNGFLKQAP